MAIGVQRYSDKYEIKDSPFDGVEFFLVRADTGLSPVRPREVPSIQPQSRKTR